MDVERHRSPETSGLETCTACHRPFVVPIAMLDLVDEGLYLLALLCTNCDRLSVGIHEDAELEQLEHEDAAAISQIEAALEVIEVSRFIDGLDGFTRALAADLVLPEDF
ncbi:MAG TPA: hypothetical protein VK501_18665 [Baekduia sp.]|uniref:hypothetical protein n=1 Tax=Baekduia sp. TaxID=2600305 RepID=UPI002CE801FB|nr:hypothetical protein [Baekduia sp.]HMJ35934.1 hypothetical protein [Baekduia sp.]